MHVAIVGAGPAGAALAFLLARRGVEVSLLERHTDFAREFRGEALQPSGVDAIRQMGLGAELDALPQSSPDQVDLYRDGRVFLSLDFRRLGAGGIRLVSQPALLEMFPREAAKFPTFRLERGFTARDLLVSHGRVAGVRGDAVRGPREVPADLVIGADGRAAVTRKRSPLDRPRPHEAFDVVWCKVPLPDFFGGRVRFHLGRGHFCIAFPAPDGRLQIGWVIEKGSFGELRRRGIDEWIDELRANVAPDLAEHLRVHRSDVSDPFLLDVVCHHLVEWSVPGLLLIGDAAHPMSPVGAQGINVALRDAIVAANHLTPVLRRGGSSLEIEAACRRVRDERLPEVKAIQQMQRTAPRFMFQQNWMVRFAADVLMPLAARLGLARLIALPIVRRLSRGVTEVTLRV